MLPSRCDSDWTSCWWTSVLWLGVGSCWYWTVTCFWELLYSSTIWPIDSCAKNFALANVIVVLPPLVAAVLLVPHAARAGAAAPAASTAPTPFTKLRRLSGEPSLGMRTPWRGEAVRFAAKVCCSVCWYMQNLATFSRWVKLSSA
jgi:hypothetical protein